MKPDAAPAPRLWEALQKLVNTLDRHRIHYVLIGGIALGFRSDARTTKDVDMLLDIPQILLPQLLEDLRDQGFQFEELDVIRQWNTEHMTVLDFYGVRVDWMKPLLPAYRQIIDRGTNENWPSGAIRVATTESMVFLKLLAFRPQDQADIVGLLSAHQGELDLSSIKDAWQTIHELDDPKLQWFEERVKEFYEPQ